jgi:hypothetical protein
MVDLVEDQIERVGCAIAHYQRNELAACKSYLQHVIESQEDPAANEPRHKTIENAMKCLIGRVGRRGICST